MFLYEVMRANAGFAESCARMAAELGDATRRSQLVRQLGARRRDGEAIVQSLEDEARRATALSIVESTVTFWVEPARPGWFERVWRRITFKSPSAFETYYRLTSSGHSADAVQCTIRIGRDDPTLGATILPRDGLPEVLEPSVKLPTAGLLSRGALVAGAGETS